MLILLARGFPPQRIVSCLSYFSPQPVLSSTIAFLLRQVLYFSPFHFVIVVGKFADQIVTNLQDFFRKEPQSRRKYDGYCNKKGKCSKTSVLVAQPKSSARTKR